MSKHLEDYKEILKKYQKLLELWEEIYGSIGTQTTGANAGDAPGSNPGGNPPPPPLPPH